MITRYRWYKINIPIEFHEFKSILSNKNLSDGDVFGFSFVDEDENLSNYRFSWKTNIISTSINLDGEITYTKIASLNIVNISFVKMSNLIYLRIVDPPRSLRDLMNALEKILPIGFYCKVLLMSHERCEKIFSHFDSVKLVGLKLNAAIQNDLIGRVELASKEGIFVDEINMLKGLNYKVDSAGYELISGGNKGQFHFYSNGSVKVSGVLADEILLRLENEFLSV